MGMSRKELEVITDLKRVCNQAPEFALAFMAGNLSVDAEITYAHRLVDIAEALLHHANARKHVVIEGHITATVIRTELSEMPPERETATAAGA